MLKKNIYTILFLTALVMGATSCKKWFDLKPADGIIRQDYWKTKEDIEAVMVGTYGSLLADPNGATKQISELMFLWGELRADMVEAYLGTTAEEYDVMNVNILPTNSIVNWRPFYQTINYCNTIIDFAPDVLNSDKTLTQEKLNNYIAEAKALRALLYFYLVRSFGEVPLKLRSTSSDEEIVSIPKNTQEEVLNQILLDLEDAEAKAATDYGDIASNKGRITRYTVNCIQADVYLWMERYEDCIAACDKVINSRRFGLIAGSAAWFDVLYRQGNSNEGIFELQYDKQRLNNFYQMFGVGNRRLIAANKVMDDVYTIDNTNNLKDLRSAGVALRLEDNVIWKYIGANAEQMVAADGSHTHWFVYRYADVLLMKAEALAQLDGRGQEALDLVYQIRNRAGALAATDLNPDPSNKQDVALFVLEERAREFMFEGKRWYDLLRYAKRNDYENLEYMIDLLVSRVPANSIRTTQAKLRDKNSHYFPIYEYELTTNKQLVQNPFYK